LTSYRAVGVVMSIALFACGRVDFTPVPGAISYVGGFVAHSSDPPAASSIDQFTAQAQQAGDVIVLHVQCRGGTPTGASVTAPGWTVMPVGSLAGMAGVRWAASFGAFAPDVAPATFTVSWSGATCMNLDELGDEFANVAARPVALDAHMEGFGTGDCVGSLTTDHAGEAIWAACSAGGTLSGISSDYTKGVDDGHDDWSGYQLASDAANTTRSVTFTNTSSSATYVVTMIALSPP
jgi:hypothetical protein